MMSRDDNGRQTLVLDAMGVIYEVGDDVADLLIPFIREKGGIENAEQIEATYIEASLGRMDAHEFWRRVNVSPELEDEYLSRFRLSNGLLDLLQTASDRFERLVCLSNDLSEWSRKLRRYFGLEPYFAGWYISGDLGVRKPDTRIYRRMVDDFAIAPGQLLFVDDRTKNLDSAATIGIQTIHYNAGCSASNGRHRTIDRLKSLLSD
jgi:putative hydrolase of the HAD superfamily